MTSKSMSITMILERVTPMRGPGCGTCVTTSSGTEGFRPEENAIRLRPRLLPGLRHATGSLPFRGRRVTFQFSVDNRAGRPHFLVNYHPIDSDGETPYIPFSSADLHTVQRYFDTLIDTLVGSWVPGWQPGTKVREAVRPKFYLFDTGVVRTLANRVRDPLSDLEKGTLLETFFLHEIRSAASHLNAGGEISYWRTPAGVEIDFIWARADTAVSFELKSVAHWQRKNSSALRRSVEDKMVSRAFGVYLGTYILHEGEIEVLPLQKFLSRLWTGKILRAG